MPNSPLGVNAHLPYIHNVPRFVSRMQKLGPRVLTACIDNDNDIPKIEALRRDLPATEVIGRVVVKNTDGEFHLKPQAPGDNRDWIASPADFLNRWGRLGKPFGSLYTLNEPGTGYDASKPDDVAQITRLVKWTCATITLATLQSISLTVLNLSVGQPQLVNDQWDPRFDDVLKLLSTKRSLHRLGLHEYLPKPGRVGRMAAMIARCSTLGIEPPKVVITECGWDTAPGDGDHNGYKSRGISGADYAHQLIDLCEGVYRPYLDSGVLLGLDPFCYGNSGGWDNYDVEEDSDFWSVLDGWRYAPGVKKVTQTIPVVTQPVGVAAAATNTPPAAPDQSQVNTSSCAKPPDQPQTAKDTPATKQAALLKLQTMLVKVQSIEDTLHEMIAELQAG